MIVGIVSRIIFGLGDDGISVSGVSSGEGVLR